MRTTSLISLIILLITAGCSRKSDRSERTENAFSDPVLREIYQAADERSAEKLLPYFDHETAAYRMAAARCVASMTDSLFIEKLSDLLKDPVPYVRLHAAFAVGQYRDSLWLPDLERAIKKSTIPEIKSEVLTAIGKCSNRQATEYLIFHEPSTAIEEAGKIWGIYYAMLRGNLREKDLRIVVAHLKSQERETRLAAAHVLSRQKEFPLNDYSGEIMEALENEDIGEVRAVLTRCFKHFSEAPDKIKQLARTDMDSRVRAEAINAFDYPLSVDAQQIVLQSLEDGSVWVAMAAAGALSRMELSEDELSKIEYLMKASPVPEVRAAIASKYMVSNEREKGWTYWNSLSENEIEKAILVDLLPNQPDVKDSLRNYALNNSVVGTAAFRQLIAWHLTSKANSDLINLSNEAFSNQLFAQSFISAETLIDLEGTKGIDTTAVLNYYHALTEEGQVETRNSLKNILEKLQVEVPPLTLDGHEDIDWEFVTEIPKSSSAIIYTDKGEIALSLLIEDAPGSVSNFISLAKEGAYDSTFFHRIVPVFVSQGGGPRGDGFGSSEHTIRSEFSNLHFGPGVVGLASAGKDTESCQFFLTHISTPHLNGRYTIMGATENGMDILEKITSGTRIDSVRYNP
jgi:cyclophilin family peptidyl-prolyl cis-trans isomerase/HEAT repeat protein